MNKYDMINGFKRQWDQLVRRSVRQPAIYDISFELCRLQYAFIKIKMWHDKAITTNDSKCQKHKTRHWNTREHTVSPALLYHNLSSLWQGPLKGFLEALGKLQKKFYAKGQRLDCPIRTYLVTARSAASSGIRALKTLRAWGLEIDEALFLAGAPKGPMLEKIRPHIYFDDQMFHVEGAAEMGTVAAHVPYGIAQKHNAKHNTSVGK